MASQTSVLLKQMRGEANQLFNASLKRVNPYESVRQFVRLDGNQLMLGQENQPRTVLDMDKFHRIFLVGGGKATAPMARAMEDELGDHRDWDEIRAWARGLAPRLIPGPKPE